MDKESLVSLWHAAIHLSEIEPDENEAIRFVMKYKDLSMFDKMDERTLLVTFVGLVVYEKKFHIKLGSTTPASRCYVHLINRARRGELDLEFIYDVGDWAAEYSDNPYVPMDNCRGLGPRAYYARRKSK